jgi:hypothetical protein
MSEERNLQCAAVLEAEAAAIAHQRQLELGDRRVFFILWTVYLAVELGSWLAMRLPAWALRWVGFPPAAALEAMVLCPPSSR